MALSSPSPSPLFVVQTLLQSSVSSFETPPTRLGPQQAATGRRSHPPAGSLLSSSTTQRLHAPEPGARSGFIRDQDPNGQDLERHDSRLLHDSLLRAATHGVHPDVERIVGLAPFLADDQDDVFSPLMLAVIGEHVECVRTLLPHCNLDLKSAHGDTPLMLAVRCGSLTCTQLLLPNTQPNAKDRNGRTALMLAVDHEDHACVDALMSASNVQKTDRRGRSALHLAARRRSQHILEALLPHSDPLAQDAAGNTALMLAAESGNLEALRTLLPVSDPRAQNHDGYTALSLAALWDAPECVRALLPHSDPHARTETGQDAAAIALEHHRWACLDAFAPFLSLTRVREALSMAPERSLQAFFAREEREQLLSLVGLASSPGLHAAGSNPI